MQMMKLLVRTLMCYLFVMGVFIFALIVLWGGLDQLIALPLVGKIGYFVILILPYLLYLLYTQTKAYQIPQLKMLSYKLLKEVIRKDTLEAFPNTQGVKMGQFWLEVTRYGIVFKQKKYIKLDLLSGVCVGRLVNSYKPETRGSTTYYFVDAIGTLVVMEQCPKLTRQVAEKLEQEIIRRSPAKLMTYAEMKAFSKQRKGEISMGAQQMLDSF